jgi:hypothetical protein
MKRQPEIIIDDDGTTWALLGTHGGKAYYGNVDKLQAPIFEGPYTIDVPPAPPPYPVAHYPTHTPGNRIRITGI